MWTQDQTLIMIFQIIIRDKDLVVQNEILKVKLKEAYKENTFLKVDVKNLTVLSNVKIQTSSH